MEEKQRNGKVKKESKDYRNGAEREERWKKG
jgi:hypothetical protein